tara:strand:+ start:1348 stop:1575 length:228 start_codon:yes stop_codon:yes gene_type:complete
MSELQKRQRAFYLQEKKILAKILESMKDKAPICDCGKKMSYNPKLYGLYRCYPCYDEQEYDYHGTECHCARCMGE